MKVLGIDIGGAYIKVVALDYRKGKILNIESRREYFPIWKRKDELKDKLREIKSSLPAIQRIGITTTAEVCDAYSTKREAIDHVLHSVEEVFGNNVGVLTSDSKLVSIDEGKSKPRAVSSANWAATSWLLSEKVEEAIMVDMGSTTTDVIPVRNHQVNARGKIDLERLSYSELIYTGILRTNLAALTQKVPVNGKNVRISSEYFANTADVYVVLGDISGDEYTCETTDGRGNSREECIARIARILCSDLEEISEGEILEIAHFVKKKQVNILSEGVQEVVRRSKLENPVLYVTGLGSFLLEDVGKKLKLEFKNLEGVFGFKNVEATCFALALMVAKKNDGD